MPTQELTIWINRPVAISEHLPIASSVQLENGRQLAAGSTVKIISVRQISRDCWEATVRSVPSH